MDVEKYMNQYTEHRGVVVKKRTTIFRKYILIIEENSTLTKVYVGKQIYLTTPVGSKVTIGKIGKQLINFRPDICYDEDK